MVNNKFKLKKKQNQNQKPQKTKPTTTKQTKKKPHKTTQIVLWGRPVLKHDIIVIEPNVK